MAQSLIEYIIKVRSEDDLDTLIPELESWNVKVLHTYKRVFPGICVLMTGLLAEWYKNDARIESIEESEIFQHFDVQTDAPPHLDRLDQRQLPLSSNFTFALDGTDVVAYILDSGGTFRGNNAFGELRGFEHVEYGGRLSPIPDPANSSIAFDPFFDNLSDNVQKNNPRGFDGLGHGTHVAGIVGSETYGVAKNVTMRTSKIFGSSGTTTGGTIIAGIDAILDDHINLGSPLAVCNMSFGGGVSPTAPETSLETAVLSLVSNGIVVVVAAGNNGVNAEGTSPARLSEVITVGAVDRNDNMANFSNFQDSEDIVAPEEFGFAESTLSNFGSVVDIFAVGVQVLSTWKDSSTAVNTLTGTSMATPGVAGVVALFIENSPGSTPAIIKTDVLSNATSGEITLTSAAITAGTPNVLVYSTFVDFVPENLPPEWITPSGNVGTFDSLVNSSVQLQATDPDAGPQPLTYTVDAGELPPGMSLDFNTGEIHGVPESVSQDTDFIFIIRVSDGFDSVTRTFAITINRINVGPEWITDSGLLISINEGQFLTLPLEATDANNDELTFTLVSGSLPSTLVLREDGFITGPIGDINVDTTFSFTVEVDDSKSNPAGEEIVVAREFSIEVLDGALNPNQEPIWVTPAGALIQATENQQYFNQIEAIDPDGNPDPIIYFVSAGDFPQGLALNQNTGEISGIPIIDDNIIDDIFTFTVKAFDGLDFAERTFSIEVVDLGDDNIPPEWITPAGSLGSFDESVPLILPLSAIDPDDDPITFSKTAGTFPPGLIMDDAGVISGTPAQVGSNTIFAFVIRVEDDKGKFTDRSFSIQILDTVNVPPFWNTLPGSLGSVDEGQPIIFILSAVDPDTGPNPTLEFNVTSGTLPPGLSLNTSTGVINGTPDPVITDTTFNFDITVDDGAAFIPRSFSITILDVTVFTGTSTDLNVPLLGELRNDWRRWNTDALIDDDDIFQIGDPNFGRVAEPVIFVVRKLHTGNPDIVFNSFGLHHHTFETLITVPDFAVVRDSLGNVIYEVIYLKIIDPQAGSDFNITNIPTPSAFDTSGIEQYISRNFFHLREELLTNIDNDDELPAWMTSKQIAGDIDSIIGYIPAIELAFVKPGKGQDILGRINEISTTVITLPSNQTTFDTILLSPTTIFDSDTTTFDKLAGTLTIINKGIGFQFAGRQLIVDRYLFENSLSERVYIKFNSDSPNPIWISVPGELGPFSDGSTSSTDVFAESPVAVDITYSIVYGNLPDGMVLNVNTGEISGTISIPGFVSPTKFPFVIRATDALGNFTDRAFAITVTD